MTNNTTKQSNRIIVFTRMPLYGSTMHYFVSYHPGPPFAELGFVSFHDQEGDTFIINKQDIIAIHIEMSIPDQESPVND